MKDYLLFFIVLVLITFSCQKDPDVIEQISDQSITIAFKSDDFKSSEVIIDYGDTVSCLRDVNTIALAFNDATNQLISVHWQISYVNLLNELESKNFHGSQIANKFENLGVYEVKVSLDPSFTILEHVFYISVEGIPGRLGDGPENNYIFRLERKDGAYYEIFQKYKHVLNEGDSAFIEYSYLDSNGNQIAFGQVGISKYPSNSDYFYTILNDDIAATIKIVFKYIESNGAIKVDLNTYLSSWSDGFDIVFNTLGPINPPQYVCGDSVTFIYNGAEVTYGTILKNGICWMDRDLGASQVCTSPLDNQCYGDLYQWGRLEDGHQLRSGWMVTHELSLTDVPGHSIYIGGNPGQIENWRHPKNDNLWQGVFGINNPCPLGWRLPTESELESERLSWDQNGATGAFNSLLKFSKGGARTYGTVNYGAGSSGHYWSSSINGDKARGLVFWNNNAEIQTYPRFHAYSVRCVRK